MLSRKSNGSGHGRALACVLAITALLAGGCSSVSNLLGTSSSSSPSTDASASAPASTVPAAGTQPGADNNDFECPSVSVRTGTATLTVGATPTAEQNSAMALKYQGSIVRTARECQFRTGTVTMKVGIEGRLITGPAGEGPEPKTVVSKLARVPVTITDGSGGVTFTHIDPDVVFPMPVPAAEIDSYIVYVGFDPAGVPPQKTKPKPRSKAKR
jgi:hypothetical protein